MRRFTIGLGTAAALLLLPAASGEALRKQPAPTAETAIQPVVSSTGLILLSRPGSARIETRGASTPIRLEPGQELVTIAEAGSGWIAGGVREDDEGVSIFFLSDTPSAPPQLPPIRRSSALQLRPRLLVLDGRLLGAAWLEGPDHRSLAVRFAEWTGVSWETPLTVAAPGRGSQTGLTGAALADGSLLLAWSRFDGRDDELYWSLRQGSRWSRPTRVSRDNRVPDVTPAVAANDRGATLVWARLDGGDYRLLSTRYEAGTWSAERPVSSAGALSPSLVRHQGSLFTLYRTAVPTGWAVTELVASSPLTRHARVEDASGLRPAFTGYSEAGPVLEWTSSRRRARPAWQVRQR